MSFDSNADGSSNFSSDSSGFDSDAGGSSNFSSDSSGSASSYESNHFNSFGNQSDGEESYHDANSTAFEHCILNFCKGEYDIAIQVALDAFTTKNESTNYYSNNVEQVSRPADWDTVEDIARIYLKDQLKKYTTELGLGKVISAFDLDLTSHHSNNPDGEPMISQDGSLESYWEAFSEALAACADSCFSTVTIPKIELSEELMDMLATNLSGKVNKSLRFVENNLCSNGIISLSKLLKGNESLSDLILSCNPFNNWSANARCFLVKAIETHPNLRYISLTACNIGMGGNTFLSSILQSGVEEVILNNNNIGSTGAAAIAECLETNPTALKHLELDNNNFNDDDAISLSRALRKNTNLHGIWVRGNNFSVAGVKSLFDAIFDTDSMNAIWGSNHVCQPHLFSGESNLQEHVSFLNAEHRDASRMTKMVTALLHSRESLLHYIVDVPVEFMPNVLSLIQEKSKEGCKLANMYTIMRWWNMPSFYMYRQHVCSVSKTKRSKRKRGC